MSFQSYGCDTVGARGFGGATVIGVVAREKFNLGAESPAKLFVFSAGRNVPALSVPRSVGGGLTLLGV